MKHATWTPEDLARFDQRLKAAKAEGLSELQIARVFGVALSRVKARILELRLCGELPLGKRQWNRRPRRPQPASGGDHGNA